MDTPHERLHPAETGCPAHAKLIAKGFTTATPPQEGLVRSYEYTKDDVCITYHVGCSMDYWYATENGKPVEGYNNLWLGLNSYLSTFDNSKQAARSLKEDAVKVIRATFNANTLTDADMELLKKYKEVLSDWHKAPMDDVKVCFNALRLSDVPSSLLGKATRVKRLLDSL